MTSQVGSALDEAAATALAEALAAADAAADADAALDEKGEPVAPGAQPVIDMGPPLIVVKPASLSTWRRSIRVERS